MDLYRLPVLHLDLLDEVKDDLPPCLGVHPVEAVLEDLRQAAQLGEVALDGLPIVVLSAQEGGFSLHLLLLGVELGDLGLTDGGIEAVADGADEVLDATVDVGELSLHRTAVRADGAALGVDLGTDHLLQLGEAVGLGDAGLDDAEHHALDPVPLDGERRTDRLTLAHVGAAVVGETLDLRALLRVPLVIAPAAVVGAAVVALDEAGEQPGGVSGGALVGVEASGGGDGGAAVEHLGVDDGGVGVLDDDALSLFGGLASIAALLAALEPDEVAEVGAVVEEGVDRRACPVRAPRRANALGVEGVGDRLHAEALRGRHLEDALHELDLTVGSEDEVTVLAALAVGLPLQAIAEGHAAAVDVAALGVLLHPLERLGGQVHRVELVDDLDHPLVEEALGGVGVEVLGDALDLDAVLAEEALEEDGLLSVPAEAVELVDEDGVHLALAAEAHHLAEAGPLVGGGIGRLALVDEAPDDVDLGALFSPSDEHLLLGGDGEVLRGLLLGGHTAVGDDLHRLAPMGIGIEPGGAPARPSIPSSARRMPADRACQDPSVKFCFTGFSGYFSSAEGAPRGLFGVTRPGPLRFQRGPSPHQPGRDPVRGLRRRSHRGQGRSQARRWAPERPSQRVDDIGISM